MLSKFIDEKQPKALYLILVLELLESFSHFGIRFLLVLYLVSQMHFEYAEAFSVIAVYIALTEGLGIVGGRFSDKFLGLYQATYLGATLMFAGCMVMAYERQELIYLGLVATALGRGIYRPCITALLGECYHKGDLRRDAGFTYLYVALNVGACLATALGGYIALLYGWKYIFLLYGCVMLLSMLLIYCFKNLLNIEKFKYSLIKMLKIVIAVLCTLYGLYELMHYHHIAIYLLTVFALLMLCTLYYVGRKQEEEYHRMINILLVAILLLGLFYAVQRQINLTFMSFGREFVETGFFGLKNVSIISLLLFDPIGVILFGPFVAILTEIYEMKKHHEANMFMKMSIGFFVIGAAYIILYFGSEGNSYTSAEIMALVFLLIGISELFIEPAVYSYASEASPKHMHATIMGAVMLGLSMSGLGSGFIAAFIAYSGTSTLSIDQYASGFIDIAMICIAIGISLISARLLKVFIIHKRKRKALS